MTKKSFSSLDEKLLESADIAISNIHNAKDNYRGVWLVIDEFNRADIDKAFGQLFTALRTRRLKIPTISDTSYKELSIPKDFRIIGTLNTQDKYFLFQLSDALKSRFAYIEIDIPTIEQKDAEIYYTAKNALTDLEIEENESLIQFNNQKKKIQNNSTDTNYVTMYYGLYSAYTVLDIVRQFKPLGTAILKLLFQQFIVSIKRSRKFSDNIQSVLDNALITNLIPQLETLSRPEIDAIIALCTTEKRSNKLTNYIIDAHKPQNREIHEKSLGIIDNYVSRVTMVDLTSKAEEEAAEDISDAIMGDMPDIHNTRFSEWADHTLQDFKLSDVAGFYYYAPQFINALEKLKDSMIS